jgi:hypothetical protein
LRWGREGRECEAEHPRQPHGNWLEQQCSYVYPTTTLVCISSGDADCPGLNIDQKKSLIRVSSAIYRVHTQINWKNNSHPLKESTKISHLSSLSYVCPAIFISHLSLDGFGTEFDFSNNNLVLTNVSFMGKTHLVVEENMSSASWSPQEQKKNGVRRSSSLANLWGGDDDVKDVIGAENGSPGSLPNRLMSEIY